MTNVNVSYGVSDPTHDLSLTDGSTTLGLVLAGGPRVLQEVPLTPPAQAFEVEQRNWIGGRMRLRYDDDPTGYFDSQSAWTFSEQKLMPTLQWRFANGLRSNDTSLPGDNSSMAWWKLYGNTPASRIARYLSISIVASASFNADKAYLWIRRRGTPGTLTLELCADSVGTPGTPGVVAKTVTLTTSDVTDTVSLFQVFNWTTTTAITVSGTYHVKIYGASTDDSSNHWEVLGNSAGTSSKYSTDNTSWTSATISMYYRVVDADTTRQWYFFNLYGATYIVSSGGVLMINGTRGIATAAGATTLTCSALSMTTNRFAGAYIRIINGTDDGDVRQIVSNTGTQFTVAGWTTTPDITSEFVVYYTDWFASPSGTPALSPQYGRPVVASNIAYFAQGQSANMRRMQASSNTHNFADDGTNKADSLYVNVEGTAPLIYAANAAAATVKNAALVTWGTSLTFGTAKSIGSSDYRITNIYSHNKVMYIFKEDGLYTYNNGIVEKLGMGFSDAPDKTTGRGVGAQNNYLWFGWAHSIERMIGSSVDDMLNFKRGYDGLPSDRVGFVNSIASGVGWLFFAINGGGGYSSVIAWNGMGFHEVFRTWETGQRIYDIYWQANPETRGRLWINVGGDLVYIDFPLYAANPLKDTSINYQHEGVLVTSTYDGHDQNLYKVLALLRTFLDAGSVEIDYQTNANVGTSTWTVLGTASTTPVTDTNLNLGEIFKIRFRFRLQVTASRTPAILSGWQISGRLMQLKRYQWLFTVRADSDATTFTDEPDHNPDTVYSQLQTWATNQTKLTLRSANQSADNKTVTVSLPSKSVDWVDTGENKWGGRITIAALQVT